MQNIANIVAKNVFGQCELPVYNSFTMIVALTDKAHHTMRDCP